MCLSDSHDMVCGRPLARVATRIWFHPNCRIKKSAWLAKTQAQLQSVKSWKIADLVKQMYGPNRSSDYNLIVTPKVANSLYQELDQLIKDGVLRTELTQAGCRVIWPDWTVVWTWPHWDGDRTEAAARAMIRAFQSSKAKPAEPSVSSESPATNKSPSVPPTLPLLIQNQAHKQDQAQPRGFLSQRAKEQSDESPHYRRDREQTAGSQGRQNGQTSAVDQFPGVRPRDQEQVASSRDRRAENQDPQYPPYTQDHQGQAGSRRQQDQYGSAPDQFGNAPPGYQEQISRNQYTQYPPYTQYHQGQAGSRRQQDQYGSPPDQFGNAPPGYEERISRNQYTQYPPYTQDYQGQAGSRYQQDQYRPTPDQFGNAPPGYQEQIFRDQYTRYPPYTQDYQGQAGFRHQQDRYRSAPGQFGDARLEYQERIARLQGEMTEFRVRQDQYIFAPGQFSNALGYQEQITRSQGEVTGFRDRQDQYRFAPDRFNSAPGYQAIARDRDAQYPPDIRDQGQLAGSRGQQDQHRSAPDQFNNAPGYQAIARDRDGKYPPDIRDQGQAGFRYQQDQYGSAPDQFGNARPGYQEQIARLRDQRDQPTSAPGQSSNARPGYQEQIARLRDQRDQPTSTPLESSVHLRDQGQVASFQSREARDHDAQYPPDTRDQGQLADSRGQQDQHKSTPGQLSDACLGYQEETSHASNQSGQQIQSTSLTCNQSPLHVQDQAQSRISQDRQAEDQHSHASHDKDLSFSDFFWISWNTYCVQMDQINLDVDMIEWQLCRTSGTDYMDADLMLERAILNQSLYKRKDKMEKERDLIDLQLWQLMKTS